MVVDVAFGFCDEAHRAKAAAFFPDKAAKINGGPRRLEQALEAISVCIAGKKAEEPSLTAFLKKR